MQSLLQSFNPALSINSGQVFLWEKHGDLWYGIHGDRIVRFGKDDAGFQSFPELKSCEQKMFRLDDDIKAIVADISRDALVRRLVKAYPGLRLMRQEPEQCIFSFVCASNTNIPMIRRMLSAMARRFGRPVKVNGIDSLRSHRPDPSTRRRLTSCAHAALGTGPRQSRLSQRASSVEGSTLRR